MLQTYDSRGDKEIDRIKVSVCHFFREHEKGHILNTILLYGNTLFRNTILGIELDIYVSLKSIIELKNRTSIKILI